MNGLINLQRCWRSFDRALTATDSSFPSWSLWEDEPESLEKLGLYHLDALSKHKCLFLLGRPGAGKSAEVQRVALGQVGGFADEHPVLISCKEVDVDVYSEVKRGTVWHDAFQQAKPVRLILDALDEGFLRSSNYFARLKRGLENLKSENPSFRLALVCRPAEWDANFGESIHSLWLDRNECDPNKPVPRPHVYVLEQLSSRDQRSLVEHRGIGRTEKFFKWVRSNNFEEFAVWPRQLEWLADEFRAGGAAKLTYTDLCRLRVTRSFTEDERLAQADRADRVEIWAHALMLLAASLVFCGKKGVTLGAPQPDCISIDEIFVRLTPLPVPGKPLLSRERLHEAVRASHLMESCGSYHRFLNQSDLEYLAAEMLASLSSEQRSELFGCLDDTNRWSVFPQLANTAANLAVQSREFFSWLLEHDPRVLMRVDFASKSAADRRSALEAIFLAIAEAKATADHDQQSHFPTLKHPHIEDQIRVWLFDKTQPYVVRQLACTVAFACCEASFWKDFDLIPQIAADDFLSTKIPAVIARFGCTWPVERLRRIAAQPEHQLAGAAMLALLDQDCKPRELAPFLHETTGSTYKSYDILLGARLTRECQTDDVPALLAKLTSWQLGSPHSEMQKLAEKLVYLGLAALDRTEVREAVVNFFITRAENHDWFFHSYPPDRLKHLGLNNEKHRRVLILAMLRAWPETSVLDALPFNLPLLREDFPWLLKEIPSSHGAMARHLARVAANFAWQLDDEHAGLLDQAYIASPDLRAYFPATNDPGIFATLSRLRAEAAARQQQEADKYKARRQPRRYNHAQHLSNSLKECRAGHYEYWTQVCYALSQPKSGHDDSGFLRCLDVRKFAGWCSASDELRNELTHIARSFLLQIKIPPPAPRQIPEDFFGIVYALGLHADQLGKDPELNAAIQSDWTQAILRCCDSESETAVNELLTLSAAAPTTALEGFKREFLSNWDANEPIFGRMLTAGWSSVIEAALAHVLKLLPLQPSSYHSGLELLKSKNPVLATEIARQHVAEYATQPNSASRRGALAACFFILNELWAVAWPHFIVDQDSARELILECSRWIDLPREDKNLSLLPTSFIGSMYGLMLKVFPLKDSPRREGARFLGPIDEAYDLQSKLLRTLESRGEYRLLKSIFEAHDEPYQEWFSLSLERARMNAQAQRRIPPDAAGFIRFLVTEGGTFVRDNDSLQRAVLASLRRYENQLHPRGINNLWDKNRPRNEAALQIELTSHLCRDFEQRGIVSNMEVKVEGQEGMDILVEAGPYSVVLEIKQAHADDKIRPVRESMRIQLRDTYLDKSGRSHGIYVVGWYFCPTFREAALPDIPTLADAQRFFDVQAQQLSDQKYTLRGLVLDCRWRESLTQQSKNKA